MKKKKCVSEIKSLEYLIRVCEYCRTKFLSFMVAKMSMMGQIPVGGPFFGLFPHLDSVD